MKYKNLTLLLCGLCLTASLTFTSCALVERTAKKKALDAAGSGIAEQIADDKDREAFTQQWEEGQFSEALTTAGKSLADDKISNTLAEKLREADAANEELARQLEDQGIKAVWQNWAGYGAALLSMLLAAMGWKKNSTKGRVLHALFAAVRSFTSEAANGEGDKLLDKIEHRADAAKVKKPLDMLVVKAGQKANRAGPGTDGT